MRILQIAPVFYPAWNCGGIVTAIYNLSKELSKRGHEVTVYTTDKECTDKRLQLSFNQVDGINIYYFKNLSKRMANYEIHLPVKMCAEIKKNAGSFDLICLQDYRFIPHIFGWYYAKKYNIPYVYQPRYSYTTHFQKGTIKKLFDISFGNRMLQEADMIIAQLPKEAEEYRSILGINREKIATIPNGVDFKELDNVSNGGSFRRKYRIRNEDRIILYLGRIQALKGIDLLIDSFKELTCNMDNIKLVIVGPDAGYLDHVKARVIALGLSDSVIVTGSLIGSDKLEAYRDADVYVLPSIYEGLSIAPLEAYGCGTPVIVTDKCGTAEWMIDEFEHVISYEKESLKNAIIQSLSDTEQADYSNEEIERRKKVLEDRFSWQKIGQLIENVYIRVIDKNAKSHDYEIKDEIKVRVN